MKSPQSQPRPPKSSPAPARARPAPAATPQSTSSPPRAETVLLAVTGMSPAVLTETIWALAHEPEPVIPSRVIVLTTSAGRAEITQQLFQPLTRFGGRTPWETLLTTLRAEGIDLKHRLRFGCTGDDLRVITAHDRATHLSRELADIRTPADNEATADFLLEQVRSVVENPDTHLIASIAGGRKTMGALLYACLTLVGRETDRLTHVLVNEPFETLREFFFPGQPGGLLTDRAGGDHDPSQAQVDLADVTFVPLRNLFVRELGRRAGTFSRLVETCREDIRHRVGEGIQLSLDCTRPEIEINGSPLRLAPREHAVLLFLATRAKNGEPAISPYKQALGPLNEFCAELRASAPARDPSDWRHGQSLKGAFEEDQEVRRAVADIRAKVKGLGGDAAAFAFCLPERGRFSLDVPASLIHIKG